MQNKTWQRLLSLETHDAVIDRHSKICGRQLSARRAKEITASAKQAREFFRNSEASDNSVKPLLTFYGVASLSRATLLLMKKDSGEAALARGHGLTTVRWAETLSGDIPKGLQALHSLQIKTSTGLFSEFVKETRNRMCMHVNSSNVDWSIDYDIPPIGTELTVGDLLSRIPDLLDEHKRMVTPAKYARINSMTYSAQNGFYAKISAKEFDVLKEPYEENGFSTVLDGDWCEVTADKEIFRAHTPQYMHTYLNKTFGSIPSLHIVKPFDGGARYSQLAVTYLLSYCLGMLARYFPTHWVSLYSADKGDGLWPEINSAQQYVDNSFPELVVELIHHSIDQHQRPAA